MLDARDERRGEKGKLDDAEGDAGRCAMDEEDEDDDEKDVQEGFEGEGEVA